MFCRLKITGPRRVVSLPVEVDGGDTTCFLTAIAFKFGAKRPAEARVAKNNPKVRNWDQKWKEKSNIMGISHLERFPGI